MGQQEQAKGHQTLHLEHRCDKTKSARSKVVPIMKAAWKHQHSAKLVRNQLVIDGAHYTLDSLHQLPQNLDTAKVSTPCINENTIAFCRQHSPLSNFHPAPFISNGQQFSSCEQYYKQRLLLNVIGKTKNASDPVVIKRVDDKVKVNHNWRQHKILLIKTGCTANLIKMNS